MSNTFSLDELRAEVENDFAPMTITVSDGTEIALRNILRLNRKDRDQVMKVLRDLEEINETVKDDNDEAAADDVDKLVDTASQVLLLVADNGKKLVKELDGDLTLTMRVLEKWMKATAVGKAPTSES